jgi:hypothetical protein
VAGRREWYWKQQLLLIYCAATGSPRPPPPRRSVALELPVTHRIPLTWLIEHGGPSIRYRALAELAPDGAVDQATLQQALRDLIVSPQVSAVTTRQQDTGLWGDNFLAFQPSERDRIEEVGTVAQYRRLLQLGVPTSTRPFRLADRVLFRALSRDPDPLLLGEFADAVEDDPRTEGAYRLLLREGICAALAEAGYEQDPRLRGAAHKLVSAISSFLRSPLAENPFVKKGGGYQLNPEAVPPTWWSLAMLSAMPSLQRERAGFIDRLTQFLAHEPPKRSYMVSIGGRTMKPIYVLLGDPVELDTRQHEMPKDVPLTLHFLELLAGFGQAYVAAAPHASRGLLRLLEDLDPDGVWHPKNLRSQPKPTSPITYHCWPLTPDDGELASRQADITFRLAKIAKRLGWRLEYS